MLYSYFVGVDLGQRQDYTAVAIIEEPVWVPDWLAESRRLVYELGLVDTPGWVSPAALSPAGLREVLAPNYREGHPTGAPLSLRHLERFPLGTPYPKIVERIDAMLSGSLLVDRLAGPVRARPR